MTEEERKQRIDKKLKYCAGQIADHVARIRRSASAITRWQRKIYNLERQREVPLSVLRAKRAASKRAKTPTVVKRVVREE